MGILARILAVTLLCVSLVACARAGEDTAEGFFRDIADGRTAAAVARFSPTLHEKFSEDELQSVVRRWSGEMRSHGGLDRMSLTGGVVTYRQLALYDVVLTFRDGTAKRVKTSLIHVDGSWYINTAL